MSGEAIQMGPITTEPKSTTMSAVDLSDVNLENGNGNGTLTEQTLTGLGPLRNAKRLVIKQRIRLCDIVSLCTGCEVRTRNIQFRQILFMYLLGPKK